MNWPSVRVFLSNLPFADYVCYSFHRRYYITTKGSSYGEFALMLSRFLFDVAKHSLSIARREWSSRRQVPPDMNLSLDWTRGFAEARIFGFLLGT